jgi:hypothetical protein
MVELVLGYDARWRPHRLAPRWPTERRDRFLLRDSDGPLSVDHLVWPSVFDYGIGIGLPVDERQRLGLAGHPPPAWIGPNVGLWDDLAALQTARADARNSTWLVAVTCHHPHAQFTAGPVGPYVGSTAPPSPAPHWRCLGYDVADGSLMSGLSNCGYPPDERPHLQHTWSTSLNGHHLFPDPTLAERFRVGCEARVTEHAPFFVFGLYAVEGAVDS